MMTHVQPLIQITNVRTCTYLHALCMYYCGILLQIKEAVDENNKKGGYSVKPPRDLTSQFEKRLANKEKAKIEEQEREKREKEETRIAEAEAPPPDSCYGLRIHCWVLVLSGMRGVAQSFFIEPTTGEDHPLDWDQYLGIETLWNHKNYWVNMQDCSQGVQVHCTLNCACVYCIHRLLYNWLLNPKIKCV